MSILYPAGARMDYDRGQKMGRRPSINDIDMYHDPGETLAELNALSDMQ
ncbi:hypothetical protein O5282_18450 [Escherichia coli]|nr:hypothetical protein [Escherichia coli]